MNKFNVGDTLLVTSTGLSYSTYQRGAERLGITNIWKKSRWASDHLTDGVSTVKVLSVVHDNGDYIYGVQCEKGMGWVIGEAGLALVEQAKNRPLIELINAEFARMQAEIETLKAALSELEDLRAFKQRVLEAVE